MGYNPYQWQIDADERNRTGCNCGNCVHFGKPINRRPDLLTILPGKQRWQCKVDAKPFVIPTGYSCEHHRLNLSQLKDNQLSN